MFFPKVCSSLFFIYVLCLFSPPLKAENKSETAETAEDLVRSTIDQIRTVVHAEKDKRSESSLEKKIEEVIFPVFNFQEMAKKSVGPSWNQATKEEQQEFVTLFSTRLSQTYINKIKDIEKHEVSYLGDTVLNDKAVVRTVVLNDKQEKISIDYRLKQEPGGWRVYDVIIENVGLISTHRHEFGEIIRKKNFSGLLEALRQKGAEANKIFTAALVKR